MNVQVKVLNPLAASFQPATSGSAGYDLVACINEPMSIRAGEKAVLIPTGLAIYIANRDVMAMLAPRSGLGHKQGLVLGNLIGVVDSDYTNQVYISAWNRGQQDEIIINPGDRIAQLIFVPVIHPTIDIVGEFIMLGELNERGMGGFGSTGA